jgi:hypothetical protein
LAADVYLSKFLVRLFIFQKSEQKNINKIFWEQFFQLPCPHPHLVLPACMGTEATDSSGVEAGLLSPRAPSSAPLSQARLDPPIPAAVAPAAALFIINK